MTSTHYSLVSLPGQGRFHVLAQGTAIRAYSPATGLSKHLPPGLGVPTRSTPAQALSVAYSRSQQRRVGCTVWLEGVNGSPGTNFTFTRIDARKLRPILLKEISSNVLLDIPLSDNFELDGIPYRQEIYIYQDTQGTASNKLLNLLRKLEAKDAQ